jgi:hypothetical protein
MNKKPSLSHRVYAVTHDGKQSYWHAIGAVWLHSDGDGFNVKLSYLPLNGADIIIRKPKSGAEEVEASPDAAWRVFRPASSRRPCPVPARPDARRGAACR